MSQVSNTNTDLTGSEDEELDAILNRYNINQTTTTSQKEKVIRIRVKSSKKTSTKPKINIDQLKSSKGLTKETSEKETSNNK